MSAAIVGRLIGAWIAMAVALAAPRALGQPTLEEGPAPTRDSTGTSDSASSRTVADARTAFHEGIALAKAERWDLALQALERSAALHPHAITTYNIGYCERQLGHSTRARKMLTSALAAHRARGGVELPPELVAAAQTYLGDSDRQIARVIVTITRGGVTVDGRPLELVESDSPRPVLLAGTRDIGKPEVPPAVTFEVLVDPGTHVFVLSVRDRADVIANETLAPGSKIALDLRVPDATEGSKLPPGPPPTQALPTDKPNRAPAFVVFGLGAAGLAVGSVSGLAAFGMRSEVNSACQRPDPSHCASERERGNGVADISTGAFIGGGVAVAVGTALLFLAPRGPSSKTSEASATQLQVRPTLGWGRLGLEGCF